ncbi:hypothetical protein JDV09_25315 [Mycobacterium sp. Y57]|nr:hypothetical protein [Mycolicibacterium xanthum]MBX7435393.1 hypothetical protein [Mycolicibacterium xanthum]
MSAKVWFITGTSRGFGREWAIAALERGDKVAATARDPSTLDDLAAEYAAALPDYAEAHAQSEQWHASRTARPGDPRASVADNRGRLTNWETWQPVAVQAQG